MKCGTHAWLEGLDNFWWIIYKWTSELQAFQIDSAEFLYKHTMCQVLYINIWAGGNGKLMAYSFFDFSVQSTACRTNKRTCIPMRYCHIWYDRYNAFSANGSTLTALRAFGIPPTHELTLLCTRIHGLPPLKSHTLHRLVQSPHAIVHPMVYAGSQVGGTHRGAAYTATIMYIHTCKAWYKRYTMTAADLVVGGAWLLPTTPAQLTHCYSIIYDICC